MNRILVLKNGDVISKKEVPYGPDGSTIKFCERCYFYKYKHQKRPDLSFLSCNYIYNILTNQNISREICGHIRKDIAIIYQQIEGGV